MEMQQTQMRKITVHMGDEYRSQVADIYQENSFFYPSFLQAGRCVGEIVRATIEYEEQGGMNILSPYAQLSSYPNNIISFCGSRGQGKTSAMVSFAKALGAKTADYRNPINIAMHSFWKECMMNENAIEMTKYSFVVLDPIDPTSMEQTDSILRIVLSRLFNRFVEISDEKNKMHQGHLRSSDYLDMERNQLIDDFRSCYKALDTLKERRKDECYYDDLSYLSDLGDSANIKNKLLTLIRDFSKYSCGTNDGFVILQIDDADLNAQRAFEITEDIRKYLVIPQVVVLLATNLKQLSMIIEQHYMDEFKLLIQDTKDSDNRVKCHEYAERYIDKLIPGIHQIHLPDLDEIIRDSHTHIELSYLNRIGQEVLFKDLETNCSEYQTVLLDQIYRKTYIVLLRPQSYRHNILPSSMRMLTHFLSILNGMENIPDGTSVAHIYGIPNSKKDIKQKEATEICLKNLELLEQYFRHIWCPLNLNTIELVEIEKLFSVPQSILHRQAIQSINKICKGDSKENSSESESNTYANVFKKIRKVRLNDEGERFYSFCFAIEFHYTLLIHRRMAMEKAPMDYLKKMVSDFPVNLPKSDIAAFLFDTTSSKTGKLDTQMLDIYYIKKNEREYEYNIQKLLIFLLDDGIIPSPELTMGETPEIDKNTEIKTIQHGSLSFRMCPDLQNTFYKVFWEETNSHRTEGFDSERVLNVLRNYRKKLEEKRSPVNYTTEQWEQVKDDLTSLYKLKKDEPQKTAKNQKKKGKR